MRDIAETAAICTAFAAVTGGFIGSIAFFTTVVLAPVLGQAAQYAAAIGSTPVLG